MRINIDTNRIDSEEVAIFCIVVGIVLLVFSLILIAVCASNSSKDDNKQLITKRVRIREKVDEIMLQSGACYIVECEDGTRIKLRNLKKNKIVIAVGDVGILQYRGETIYSFQAEPSINQVNF